MNEHSERRKEARKKLMAFTPVHDQDKGILLGYIRDLTLYGILVISEKILDINKQITLAIELPGGLPEITATRMTIPARVVRCMEDESSQTYKIGFEFTDVKPEHLKIIQALLERYHFRYKTG
ncbi:MAG: PilZ domain-containing protein [Anaerolineales bacterium]|nr:PilZ domain-containing protein [Anaerolineales bacterium]